MFCKNCGKEIHDEAVMCVHCGASTGHTAKPGENEPASGGIIALSILIPICGIILGCINISNEKKRAGKTYLWCGIISWIITIIATAIMIASAY